LSSDIVGDSEGGVYSKAVGIGQVKGDLEERTPVLCLLVNGNNFSEIPYGEWEGLKLDTDLEDIIHTISDATLNHGVLDLFFSQ